MQRHLLLSSYVADIPETEDLSSCQRGSQTELSCHVSYENKNELTSCTNGAIRKLHCKEMFFKKLELERERRC